jgi:ribosome-associated heat shock protein Hsp15
MPSTLDKVRVDKWLWAVRIFKSRTMATNACKNNKVRVGEQILKPSSTISVGTVLEVRKEGYHMQYKVVDLLDKRVSAKLAEPCYENLTSEDELNKFKDWYLHNRANAELRMKGEGRPTKRDRRNIDKFKDY